MTFHYYIIHKPYEMLSQFTAEVAGQITLTHLDYDFPKDVYPVGRLDADSEGLLLLTNDNDLKTKLLNPNHQHERTYWVQVEKEITEQAVEILEKGVTIKVNKKPYLTQPAKVQILIPPPEVPERVPPVRFRKEIPTAWIAVTLTEGKNRQVRLMTAKVGFPTLRLIRVQMGKLRLGEMKAGEVREIGRGEI